MSTRPPPQRGFISFGCRACGLLKNTTVHGALSGNSDALSEEISMSVPPPPIPGSVHVAWVNTLDVHPLVRWWVALGLVGLHIPCSFAASSSSIECSRAIQGCGTLCISRPDAINVQHGYWVRLLTAAWVATATVAWPVLCGCRARLKETVPPCPLQSFVCVQRKRFRVQRMSGSSLNRNTTFPGPRVFCVRVAPGPVEELLFEVQSPAHELLVATER